MFSSGSNTANIEHYAQSRFRIAVKRCQMVEVLLGSLNKESSVVFRFSFKCYLGYLDLGR
jgi:hypothetical protein